RHSDLLEHLSPEQMSEDETDTEEPSKLWRIIDVSWRSDEFSQMLRRLDTIYIENFYHQKGSNPRNDDLPPKRHQSGQKGPSRGNFLPSRASPLKGLQQNCYNPVWLNSLPKWQLKKLDIKKGDYNFSIDSQDLLRTKPGNRWRY
ncbi:hypothetical protein BDN72DRAFT_777233, partial [Pluteus cervinus]